MRNRGIVLVTSLVLAAVLVMFVTAALNLAPGHMQAGQASLYQLDAERAAQSGIEYALAQLRHDPAWRGNRNMVTIDTPAMIVVENEGNISGLIQARDGQWSQFRLRFNFQDAGTPGPDLLPEPSFAVELPYVSVNNLQGAGSVEVPRADGPGYSVTAASAVAFQVPTWSVSLAVQGSSGLIGVDPGAPEVAYAGRGRRKVIEAVYQVPVAPPSFTEACAMAGGDFTGEMGAGAVNVTASSPGTPRMRVKRGVAGVAGGASVNYSSPSGEILTPSQTVQSGTNLSAGTTVKEELYDDPFYELSWADVKKATASPETTLQAGTYVRWQNGSLHYYDMSYDDYVSFIQANPTDPGTPFTLPDHVATATGPPHKLVVKGDLHIEPGATNELNLITRQGAPEFPPDDPEKPGGPGEVNLSWAKHWIESEGDFKQMVNRYFGPGGLVADSQWGALHLTNSVTGQSIDLVYNAVPGSEDFVFNGTPPPAPEEAAWFMINPTAAEAAGWTATQKDGCFGTLPVATVASITGLPEPGQADNGEIRPPSVSDNLSASDLELEFAPPPGQSAVISSEGDIRITGAVTGVGGTITSGGEIKIVGLGANLASQDNPVNLYAVGDITFSTLDESAAGSGHFSYKDVNLKGIVYTQGSFRARLGSPSLPVEDWGRFNLQGMLIAYGGTPGVDVPGAKGGHIDLRASEANLDYNTGNSGALPTAPPTGFQIKRLSWSDSF